MCDPEPWLVNSDRFEPFYYESGFFKELVDSFPELNRWWKFAASMLRILPVLFSLHTISFNLQPTYTFSRYLFHSICETIFVRVPDFRLKIFNTVSSFSVSSVSPLIRAGWCAEGHPTIKNSAPKLGMYRIHFSPDSGYRIYPDIKFRIIPDNRFYRIPDSTGIRLRKVCQVSLMSLTQWLRVHLT